MILLLSLRNVWKRHENLLDFGCTIGYRNRRLPLSWSREAGKGDNVELLYASCRGRGQGAFFYAKEVLTGEGKGSDHGCRSDSPGVDADSPRNY